MRSLFELISKYRSDVINIPLIAIGAIIFTLFLYIFLNKRKWIKYIPGVVAVLVATVFIVQGYFELLTVAGLDFIDTSIKIFVFGFTVIFFSVVLDILDSFGKGISKSIRKRKSKRTAKANKTKLTTDTKLDSKVIDKQVVKKDKKDKVVVNTKAITKADVKSTKPKKIIKK